MGCNASKNVAVVPIDGQNGYANRDIDLNPGDLENATVNNVLTGEHGMSFEITFDDNESKKDNTLPRRILEMQESDAKEPPSLEKLQEKLDEAEIRRQQILQQRVQSAKEQKKAQK